MVEAIRAKIASGTLPRSMAAMLWASKGNGQLCDGCEMPINDIQHEFDVPDGRVLRFHRACFYFWDSEREQRA
jgi:hypothetical protein